MSSALKTTFYRETMPQTVPSVGCSSSLCDYSAFTTDFDLSLLPSSPEGEVPLSPNLSPYLYLYPSSPPMFSATLEDGIICDNLGFVNIKAKITTEIKSEFEDEPLHTPLKKTPSSGFFEEPTKVKENDEEFNLYTKKEEKIHSPLIPTTIQTTSNSYYTPNIKQEPNFGLDYGHSEFPNNPPSPYAIKTEKTVDLQGILETSEFFQHSPEVDKETKQYATLRSLLKNSKEGELKEVDNKPDHQLLRSVLRDTSFQKKFHIKPFEIPKTTAFGNSPKSLKMEEDSTKDSKTSDTTQIVEELTSEKIEPVFSLAIEQVRKDVENTCNALAISNEPTQWSEQDTRAWLLWTVRQFSLPMINTDCFNMDGAALCRLAEEDFQRRAPQSGSTLYAHLEIWKAASNCGECSGSGSGSLDVNAVQWSPTMHSSSSSTGGDLTEDEDEEMDVSGTPCQSASGTASQGEPSSSSSRSRASSGSHIHLWQFLKELLASPQAHGSCIRWLDRQKGVFKIEDSVRVARLWGKRKNRPAMNYDKLSRSIRQYYKKGIMKKTERSQRLVYQFCHPYSL